MKDGRGPRADFSADAGELLKAKRLLEEIKCAVFIVSSSAGKRISAVLDRIPEDLRDKFSGVFVIDDSSDPAFNIDRKEGTDNGYGNLKVLRTPFSRGYGGIQKLGFLYCIRKKFDVVVLLSGDGQYAPECIHRIVNAFEDISVDAVIGSRKLGLGDVAGGRIPFYKWAGNRILTAFENMILNASLSDFHSGYRAYRINAIRDLPFLYNSDDFHFDTEILIQLLALGRKVVEVAVPAFHGEKVRSARALKYARNCIKSAIKYRLVQLGLFYEPNFDFGLFEVDRYYFKLSPRSLHQHMIKKRWDRDSEVCELGANRGELSAHLAEKVKKVTAVDRAFPRKAGGAESFQYDLNQDFVGFLGRERYDVVVALDLIEHLDDPAECLRKIFQIIKPGGHLLASTANVGYIVTRMSLLSGHFNYGKRGILDLTHKRLFTIYSFKKLLAQNGFIARDARFFGPPVVDLISGDALFRGIEAICHFLARIYPSMFAYNFLIEAQRVDAIEDMSEKWFE
jgi:SAM-dependent methyltransferase